MSLDVNLGIFGSFIRSRDTSEFLDLTSLGLLVETFRITLLNDIERSIGKDFDKGNTSSLVKSSSGITVSSVRTNESSDGNNSGISE